MLRSMYSGVSGLRSHQTMMDTIGNNIANVNTVGYKSSTVVFSDMLSQILSGAAAPAPMQGGQNPAQVGLGVRLAGTTTNFTQGSVQATGRATDLAIQGDGFFIVNSGGVQHYTRAGAFNFDALGQLVSPDGAIVQGWVANNQGQINTNAPVQDLRIPIGQIIQPVQTSTVTVGGNLPAGAEDGEQVPTTISVIDAQGTEYSVTVIFEKTDADEWTVTASIPDPADPSATIPLTVGPSTQITFDPATGQHTLGGPLTLTFGAGTGWVGDATVNLNLGDPEDPNALAQFAGEATAQAIDRDGYGIGFLRSFSVSPTGVIEGVFSNGVRRPLGQVALANFNNPTGLIKAGGTMFQASANSGVAQIGTPGTGELGSVSGGMTEMSNVDLAQEFTNLIIAQRGFQANSRVISASDEILQDLVNLKR